MLFVALFLTNQLTGNVFTVWFKIKNIIKFIEIIAIKILLIKCSLRSIRTSQLFSAHPNNNSMHTTAADFRCADAHTGKIHGADLCFSHIKIRQLGGRYLQKIMFVVRRLVMG